MLKRGLVFQLLGLGSLVGHKLNAEGVVQVFCLQTRLCIVPSSLFQCGFDLRRECHFECMDD